MSDKEQSKKSGAEKLREAKPTWGSGLTSGALESGTLNSGGVSSGRLTSSGLKTDGLSTGSLNTGGLISGGLRSGSVETGEIQTGKMETGQARTQRMSNAPESEITPARFQRGTISQVAQNKKQFLAPQERDLSGATAGASGGAETPWRPFTVIDATVYDPDEEDITASVYVDDNSDFYKTFSDKQTITGLGQEFGTFTVATGSLIWLSITVNSTAQPTAAAIAHGSPWSGHPNPIVLDSATPPVQQYYKKIIAEVVSTSDPRSGITCGKGSGAVKIIQRLEDPLIATQWAVNGRVCLVPEELSV